MNATLLSSATPAEHADDAQNAHDTGAALAARLAYAAERLGVFDVRCTCVPEGHVLPLCVSPLDPALASSTDAFIAWYRTRLDAIDALLDEFGAILWRGFKVPDTASFARLGELYPPHAHGYTAGAAPRNQVAGAVYESTRMPPPFKIGLHQEKAYMAAYPRVLAFYCRVPAEAGGETPLSDMRAVTRSIPQAVRAQFDARGVMYRRNFAAPDSRAPAATSATPATTPTAAGAHATPFAEYHRPWHEAFATRERVDVEALCVERALGFEWLADGSVTVSHTGAALHTHPRTAERVWFNQASAQHPNARSMGELSFRYLQRLYGERLAYPYEIRFGDGLPMSASDLTAVYDAIDTHERAFRWQAGDVLVVDNMLVAHGRNPYKGPRDVQVMMFD
ncbi:TauD/TfdA family dioxygenase [Paraburkholderia xenovorans]|uniref:TauD/TfdA family dioxygenase n=1 Tax=Paraburkholderia xenovorans TaxID=36873 RepID=UPI0038BB5A4E